MLDGTLVFLVVALIAGALGFGVLAGMPSTAAKALCFIFLELFIVKLSSGVVSRRVA
jgi:uncharacterized membrane protein YtjA (UPF0391 family)